MDQAEQQSVSEVAQFGGTERSGLRCEVLAFEMLLSGCLAYSPLADFTG